MPQTSYKVSEARKNFAEVLGCANQDEDIAGIRGNGVYARIGSAADGGKRPFGKRAKAVTADVLVPMLATCADEDLRDVRDRAILMVGFASGGRRGSEIAGLRRKQLTV